MKRAKKFLSVCMALIMIFSIVPMSSITVTATESVAGNYEFDYNTLTGSGVTDIVNVALANLGRTTASLGYNEPWCADFVSDCARLVGVENLIPFNGVVSNLRQDMLNVGGTIVSSRQKGDIVFYYCNYCGYWCHVGIVLDDTYSIEGNVNDQIYKVAADYRCGGEHSIGNGITRQYIRPNYPNGPIGKVESVDGSGNAIRIKGWAYDPDVPTESIDIHVYVNNEIYVFNANEYRKDIGDKITGIGNYHGFDVIMPTLAAGTYSVRVLLVNNTWANGNKSPFIYTASVQVTHPHSYTTAIIKQATCTTTGIKQFTCSCGHSYTEIIPVTEHIWENATCTLPKKCSVCGKTSGSILGHNYTSIITKEPTCQEEGIKTYTCSICGDTYTSKIDILTHTYNLVVTNPTCTQKGFTTYTCVCGDKYITNYIDSTGHNYLNGNCVNCGAIEQTIPSEPEIPDEEISISIKKPSRTTIRHKDGIILHADIEGELPDDASVVWYVSNDNFDAGYLDDGTSCVFVSANNGYTTIYAVVEDADGNELAFDSIEMRSKAGFFDKIGSFFRSLFGGITIYEY